MPGYAQPTDLWLPQKLSQLAGDIAVLKAQAVNYMGWFEPPLLNSWAYFGSPQNTPAYRVQGDTLRLKGLVRGGATGTEIFTLEEGHRPSHNTHGTASWVSESGEIKAAQVKIVAATGAVVLEYGAGTLSFFTLDGLDLPM